MFAKFLPAEQQKSSVRWFWTENTWLVLENITVWMEMVRLLVRNSWRCLQVSLQTSSLVVFNDSASWFERRRHRDTTRLAQMSTWTDLQFCRNAACWHYFSETWLNWWRSSADVVLSWTSKHMRVFLEQQAVGSAAVWFHNNLLLDKQASSPVGQFSDYCE